MPPYVPPHLRPGYKPAQGQAQAQAQAQAQGQVQARGVHYASNKTGLRSDNEQWHRFAGIMANLPPPTRAETAAAVSRSLARRTLRAKPLKGSLSRKGSVALKGSKRQQRRTRSASPKKAKRPSPRAKSL